MKHIFAFAAVLAVVLSCNNIPEWDWEENFDGTGFNVESWSKVPRGTYDWRRYMSDLDSLYVVHDGMLTLRGIVNPGIDGDDAPVLTGGLWSKDKVGFGYGKIEIRARLAGARSAWPAIWMLPFDNSPWPNGGEIDIMERLNSEDIFYTTAHTPFTQRDTVYEHSSTALIDATGWNVYGLAHYRDSLVWSVNGVDTYTYSRMADGPEGQWPFDREFYLILSMQLSGEWVGPLCTEDLPTTMDIDWIRFRKFEE